MELAELKAQFRARLAAFIEIAKEARKQQIDAAILIAPHKKAELLQQYELFCEDADQQLVAFDAQPLMASGEPWEVRRAALVAECEQAKRVYWGELVREALTEPDLDITSEHDRFCIVLDGMVAKVDRAHVLIRQSADDARDTMSNIAIALHQGDLPEAQRLMAAFKTRRAAMRMEHPTL